MSIRKDDKAYGVLRANLDKKGFPEGGNIETDDDTGFNRQCPPGENIANQMLAQDTQRVAKLKPNKAATLLASGTKTLN